MKIRYLGITKYIRLFLSIGAFYTLSDFALADEAWVCEGKNGEMHRSEKNSRPGFCRQLKDDELFVDIEDSTKDVKSKTSPARRFCESAKGASCKLVEGDFEVGTLNNVDFRLYSDGSGSVVSVIGADITGHDLNSVWPILCIRDKMTERKSCAINKGDLFITIKPGGGVLISVGSDHFPRSLTSIKVGNRRFDTAHHDGDFSNGDQILSLMKNGAQVVTRYMKWPYRQWVDEEYNIYGLQVAVQAAKWQLGHGNIK